MKEKGISLVSLIIPIIVIILLATIGGYYTIDTLNKNTRMDIEEELRNVEELVSVQRVNIQAGKYEVPADYIATDTQIDDRYSKLLSTDAIRIIKETNNNANISPVYKYHLMNQEDFDKEFKDDVNVRYVKREYLINYGKKVVVLNADGKLYIVGKIEEDEALDTNEIVVKYSPDGNITWAKEQKTTVTVNGAVDMNYEWLQTREEPSKDEITHTFFSGDEIKLEAVTGNDWYLWVYAENENGYSIVKCSDPFYIDNTAPEGTLKVE